MSDLTQDLSPRELIYLEYYLVDFVQERARVKAKLSKPEVSRLMARPDIDEIIADMVRVRRSCIGLKQRIIEELQILAFSDITDVAVNKDGEVEAKEGLSPAATRAVSSYECVTTTRQGEKQTTTTRRVKVNFHNKIEAKRLLAQILGMVRNNVTVTRDDGTIEFEGEDGTTRKVDVKALAAVMTVDQMKQLECRLLGEEGGNLSTEEVSGGKADPVQRTREGAAPRDRVADHERAPDEQ